MHLTFVIFNAGIYNFHVQFVKNIFFWKAVHTKLLTEN